MGANLAGNPPSNSSVALANAPWTDDGALIAMPISSAPPPEAITTSIKAVTTSGHTGTADQPSNTIVVLSDSTTSKSPTAA